MKPGCAVQLISTFDCPPIEPSLRQGASSAGFAAEVRLTPPPMLSQHMLTPTGDSEDIVGTIVVIRLEDWLRAYVVSESGQLSDGTARQELRKHLDEFLSHLAILALRGRPVWMLTCPSNGWIAEQHKLATLCRTMTNLFAVRVRNLPQISVLKWPDSLSNEEFVDREADKANHIPFTNAAFEQLGTSIASQVAMMLAATDPNAEVTASAGSAELAAFLTRLLVTINVAPSSAANRTDVARILRTAASFSLAGENPTMSEAQVDQTMNSQHCYIVSVSDRLSDYGVSGLLTGRTAGDAFIVETLSLSCTVLGKQVEYALLSALAQIAAAQHLDKLVFDYRPSGRNQPMLAFLRSATNAGAETQFVLPVNTADTRVLQAAIAPNQWSLQVQVLPAETSDKSAERADTALLP